MRSLIFVLFTVLAAGAAQSGQTFVGTITDAECSHADHSGMRMGPTDAECARACADSHGAAFVLWDGQAVFELSDQKSAARYLAQRVSVHGVLDAASRTIRVDSIEPVR